MDNEVNRLGKILPETFSETFLFSETLPKRQGFHSNNYSILSI